MMFKIDDELDYFYSTVKCQCGSWAVYIVLPLSHMEEKCLQLVLDTQKSLSNFDWESILSRRTGDAQLSFSAFGEHKWHDQVILDVLNKLD